MEKVWKEIIKFGIKYNVSNFGDIIDCKTGKIKKHTILKDTGRIAITLGKGNGQKPVKLHRILAEAFIPNPNNLPEVDYIDGNVANNDISNLRWCTRSQNAMNTGSKKGSSSKYKGVYSYKTKHKGKRFMCKIYSQGKNIYSKTFDTEEEASHKYNEIALKLYGNFAKLNEVI